MRTATLVLLLSGCASLAHAADTFTQKPAVAPSVPRADEPAAKPDFATADWAARFEGGPAPVWVWGADPDRKYFLRTTFDGKAAQARVRFTADNHVKLYLNGALVGACDEWQDGAEADVTRLLKDEGNELVAEVWNAGGASGFVLKLVLNNGKATRYVTTTDKWTAAEKADGKGAPVKTVAKYGAAPWGKVLDAVGGAAPGAKVPADTFVTLPGYTVEKLFTVPKAELGSWVSLTADDKGRLIASDQDKHGLVRVTPPKVGTADETKVERIPAKVTGAQGLLWHKGALYVVCNGGPGSGLYRVSSSKGDDTLDKVEKLKDIKGGGEHGPHAVRLGPDGKSLYVVAGNFTQVPEGAASRVPPKQSEDHLLPRMWDAQGHARGILAPGGWVARCDLDGKNWEVFSSGYRNAYDFAFNADGEMFVYDSDMEWDMGMPWYRPTRVTHTVPGGDYGWRSGSGVWPSHYLDSLPAMLDVGPGSPVGVEFGYGAKFPAKYQKALFLCDWTFGTMYAVHIEPSGATYKATKEEFLSRTPLPLTDLCVNPADGALYFTIGGRGAQSELFRVTYTGSEPTTPVDAKTADTPQRDLLRQITARHWRADEPAKAVASLLPLLRHEDRFVRHTARVALEHQPVDLWQDKVLADESALGTINGVAALARQGDKGLQPKLLAALDRFVLLTDDDLRKSGVPAPAPGRLFAPGDTLLELLRAYQLVFTRTGPPPEAAAKAVLDKLDRLFPSTSDAVNRELVQLLVYLKSPVIVGKVCAELQKPSKPLTQEGLDELILRNRGYGGPIANLIKNAADPQKLWYVFTLRNATAGWTPEHRRAFYAFVKEALTKSGGASYRGFLKNIEAEAFAAATEAERSAIEAALLRPSFAPATLPKPQGPGREWTTADVVALEDKLKGGRNFKNGERAFAAARCVVCHRFGGDGGATGPDLSQVAGRFGLREMAEAIVEPSKVISDQYKASVIRTADDKIITGKVVNAAGGKLVVVTDPEDANKTVELKAEDVASVTPSNISLMPAKLLNDLNEGEVLDLLAYMFSRGDPGHPMFKKK